jgi:hypothetical protein
MNKDDYNRQRHETRLFNRLDTELAQKREENLKDPLQVEKRWHSGFMMVVKVTCRVCGAYSVTWYDAYEPPKENRTGYIQSVSGCVQHMREKQNCHHIDLREYPEFAEFVLVRQLQPDGD